MNQDFSFNQKEIANAPKLPGCYLFKNKINSVIYVGKAVSIKNRLTSYLSKGVFGKTKALIKSTAQVSVIVTENELESLILESLLIKKYLPKYNVLLKDDKSYLYIKITDEKYPRIVSDRKTDKKIKPKYVYGPFPSSYQAKYLLKVIRRIYPFCTHKIRNKACLDYQIGLCDPCPSIIEKITDKNTLKKEQLRYKSNVNGVRNILSGNLRKVRTVIEKNIQSFTKTENYDLALKERFKLEAYDYITQKKSQVEEFLVNPNYLSDLKRVQLISLQKLIGSKKYFKQVECFDIAHLSGSYTTASVIRFTDGIENKRYYRHLKIYGNPKANDIMAMKEVAERRKKHFKDWGKPDLMLIDGGVGQVNAFMDVLGREDVVIIGYEKGSDNLVFSQGSIKNKRVRLKNQPSEPLIRHLIAEAHRFARRYHHHLIKKSLKVSFP